MAAIQISNIKKTIITRIQSPKFIGAIVFVMILFVWVKYSFVSDEHRNLVESFIREDALINEKVGLIDNLTLTKITSVGIDISDKNAYKEYVYNIDGSKVPVRLIAVLTEEDGLYIVKIKSIKRRNKLW